MKPSALFEALHALISQRVPLHIWGACGVGKSQIVAQVATSLNYEFLDIRAVQLDPVDLRGLPRIAPNGCPRSFCRQRGRASCFWMS
jgi:MoxR-like ATPase